MDRTSPSFIYAFILTRSRLGLLHVIFRICVPELWPLIYAQISFPFNACHFSNICTRVMALDLFQKFVSLNILRTNRQNFTNFFYAFILTRSMLGLLHIIFGTFVPVMAVDLSQNLVSVQYVENKWTEFHQTLYNY